MGNPRCVQCSTFKVGKYIKTVGSLAYFECDKHGVYTTSAGPLTFEDRHGSEALEKLERELGITG